MRRIDLYFDKLDTSALHVSLGVKIHAAIMEAIPSPLAERFHKTPLLPYSLFVFEQNGGMVLRVSAVDESADALLDAAKAAPYFEIKGADRLRAARAEEHPAITARELQALPPSRDFRATFASPAVYKRDGWYRNLPNMEYLLGSAARKAWEYQSVYTGKEELAELARHIHSEAFSLRTETYRIKRDQALSGLMGNMRLRIDGDAQTVSKISFLLRFAAYSGVGAKTAMGMGGFMLE